MSDSLTDFLVKTAEEYAGRSLDDYRIDLDGLLAATNLPEYKKRALRSGDLLRLFHVLEHEANEAHGNNREEREDMPPMTMNILARYPPR